MKRFLRRNRGTSYSLPFVLLIPFYLTFMLTAVEVAFLLTAKIGTQYAASAGARTAAVWLSAKPEELRDARIRQSVFTALAPYVCGREREVDGAGPQPPKAEQQATDYSAAIIKSSPGTGANDPGNGRSYGRGVTVPDAAFLERKYKNAAGRTRVEITADPSVPTGDLKVTVTFRAPLYMPVVSRFLDPDGEAPFEYPITSSATIQNDAPKTRDHEPASKPTRTLVPTPSQEIQTVGPSTHPKPLGIDYHSAERKK